MRKSDREIGRIQNIFVNALISSYLYKWPFSHPSVFYNKSVKAEVGQVLGSWQPVYRCAAEQR